MSNGKNFIKAFLLTGAIIVGFLILFQILGFRGEEMSIIVATIIVFSMILCTYAIIDEIRMSKNTRK